MPSVKLIYNSPERDADLYYTTRFWAPDPYIYVESRGKKYLVLSDLEIDRAKSVATVDRVLSITDYVKRAEKKKKKPSMIDLFHEILIEHKTKNVVVPGRTSFQIVDGLRKRGYKIKAGSYPFYEKRFCKTPEERKYIGQAQHAIFKTMHYVEMVLARSRIKKDQIIYDGQPLTSDNLRLMINIFLLERGYTASDTIVSSGRHSIDPHDIGEGYLKPHQPIIVDIFPRSQKTLYYGDATRTFCKGHASDALKKLYKTVQEGQALGISKIRAGINGRKIHEAILKFFESRGYKTGEHKGRQQGFFHSTGHGIGLELHEDPARIGPRNYILKAGNVMSVEPGLYYAGIGGVRIEDLVYVTKKGCEVIGFYPKRLEIP